MITRAIVVLMALVAAACAPLTAQSPLFSVVDQIGDPPLAEGIWVMVSKECSAEGVKRSRDLPKGCEPAEFRRLVGLGWSFRTNETSTEANEKWYGVIVPATEHPSMNGSVPLYLAEYADAKDTAPFAVRYAAIIPIGPRPAKEALVIQQINCTDILNDGDIPGVNKITDDEGNFIRCVATTKAAVRDAVRRGVIDKLGELDDNRMIYVHR
jgi:hypothetical protein